MDYMAILKKYGVLIGVGVVVLVVAFSLFLINNGVTNKGNQKEADLNDQYRQTYSKLSDCVVRIRETAGVAKGQSEAFDKIITDAVQGRYVTHGSDATSASPDSGSLFSAIVEAYPNLDQIGKIYQDVLTVVNGCRSDYQGYQEKLSNELGAYQRWRTGSWTVRTFGGDEFPSDNLEAKKGEEILTGKAAYTQMKTMIVIKDAEDAYNSGNLNSEDPFGTSDDQ